jgi:hypothetical protein
VQGAAERAEVVPDPERARDDAADPPERPPLGLEPGSHGPLLEQGQELVPLRFAQPRGTPRRPALPERAQPISVQALLPLRHRCTADAHLPGNLGLRELARTQHPGRCQPALLQLRPREAGWLPDHGSTS